MASFVKDSGSLLHPGEFSIMLHIIRLNASLAGKSRRQVISSSPVLFAQLEPWTAVAP